MSGDGAGADLLRRVSDELVNGRNLAAIGELFHPDFVSHTSGDDLDIAAFTSMMEALLAAFPDARVATDLCLGAGELVAWRSVTSGTHLGEWLGFKPTGRHVSWSSLNIARVADGKVCEHWGSPDMLSLLAQLDVASRPA